jgi:Zn-dependent metalloprotease
MSEEHDNGNRCFCAFLPPYVVRRLADSEDPAIRRLGIDTIQASAVARTRRLMQPAPLQGRAPTPGLGRRRAIYDMEGQEAPLPGTLRRKENQSAAGVADVDQAYDHAGTTHGFYKSVLRRESLDGAGYPLKSSVNFGFEVANAFWEGTQMVYGAGDGDLFLSFTRSLGIAAHEMTHGLLSFTSNLAYQGEPGALNESFCDVIGISVEHFNAKTPVSSASWFVGADVIGPGLGDLRGFRSFMAEPAYKDHPLLGTDPQPKHMRDFVDDPADNGGVHTNSGIPNHAFYLAAMEIGGNVWDCATKIWYHAFTVSLNPQATFAQAARATEAAARLLYSDQEGDAVAQAWFAVGVEPRV